MKLIALSLVTFQVFTTLVSAKIITAPVEYKDGDAILEGYVAYDDAIKGTRPGVLVVHDWTGLQDYTKSRTEQLAALGYVAFAADIYGKGVRPTEPKDCGAEAGKYKKDLPLLRKRVTAGLEELKKQTGTDPTKLAAIGYCFGGTSVLELARSGAELNGVVSFHGNLASSMPTASGQVKASVLVCHGADDPHVKPDEVAAFKEEMKAANAKMEFISYPGAVHSFTKPAAGNDNSKGSAYNEKADKESWEAMKQFFAGLFGE